MLGKDYMLAIILVNCDDNLWSDQSLETDPDLPPGWRKIHDSLGTYYWHVPTGTTQWQHPALSSNLGGFLEADGEETLQETDCQVSVVKHTSKARPVPSPMASLTRRASLTWQGDDFQQCGAEPSSKPGRGPPSLCSVLCCALTGLGGDPRGGPSAWQEQHCCQQLHPAALQQPGPRLCRQLGRGPGPGDDPEEGHHEPGGPSGPQPHPLSAHPQHPRLGRRLQQGQVLGAGRGRGCAAAPPLGPGGPRHELTASLFPHRHAAHRDRDFAFVASDKDTCVLKCHVFRCNVPAKGIAKALHGMCSQIVAERAAAGSRLSPRSAALESISAATWPLRTADVQDAVGRPPRQYEALYIGSRPVPRAMGMDVLNAAIEQLLAGPGRHSWTPAHVYVSDTAVRVRRAQVGPGRGRGERGGVGAGPARRPQEEDGAHVWQCEVRYVTFLGVGRDAHTFALIADTGRRFQCAAFWCEPDAGTISEAVQAACMVSGAARGDGEADREPPAATPPAYPQVQYQKCLVAAAPGPKAKRATAGGAKAGGGSGGAAGPGPRKRGVLSLLEAFRQRHALLHLP
ncbi:amyloid-beta A4 precursor protein-binding family B member 3 isoform X2 [Lagopus muta]|uniref:amyloid-beta A4 precursor protein-binding family B member 3 isoform X2 n=1 Tax=Lagopus muta TaxID=64668 RepID=UPI00209D638A|nr:amyloid-beta A4 precursor protein-binding family B member 3 isoform X2 [Lagopus muta]